MEGCSTVARLRGDKGIARSPTLEEFLEDVSQSPHPELQNGGPPSARNTQDIGGVDTSLPPPLESAGPLQRSDAGLEGIQVSTRNATAKKNQGSEMSSPTRSTGSQVPVLNAVEAEENSWSDPCLLNDRVDLSTTIVNLAEEFRRVSFGHHEASSPSTINCKREARPAVPRQQEEPKAVGCSEVNSEPGSNQCDSAEGSKAASLRTSSPFLGEPVARKDKDGTIEERVGALATALRNVFASEDFAPLGPAKTWPKMIAEVLTTAQWQGRPNCMEVEPAAIAMAEQLLKLQGKPCNTASQSEEGLRVKGPIREALAEQLQWEEKLEKELHMVRLHQQRLAKEIACAKARRQQMEKEHIDFVPFAAQELEQAMKQMEQNRRAPESLRRLVASTGARTPPQRRKTVKNRTTARLPQETFGRVVV
ncbi:unnamed protein product [Durusdinium trenchii]|uniref:Uncharacterized protein n=1 Tax=Durusdinium trenchii TaxID=1381693 RepID=A0ABP0HCA6_9DINO